MKKKALSLLLTLAMLLSLIPAFGTSVAATGEWYTSGDGTASNPYVISGYDGLNDFAAYVNEGNTMYNEYVILADDFPVAGMATALTTPIGKDEYGFCGTFDGNGKTVELNINSTTLTFVGLFGGVYCATIKNVFTIGSASTTADSGRAGGIAGKTEGITSDGTTNMKIINCGSLASLTASSSAAGIVATMEDTEIVNCYAAPILNTATYKGGIAGWNATQSEKVPHPYTNCYSTVAHGNNGAGTWETMTAANMQLASGDNALVTKLNSYVAANLTTDCGGFLWVVKSGVNNGYPVLIKLVCAVGNIKYPSVQAAIDAAGVTPTTIVMIADSTENVNISKDVNNYGNATTNDCQTITLDLNGYVLQGDGTAGVITANGVLTIKDSNPTATHYFKVNSDGLWVWDDTQTAAKYTFSEADGLKTVSDGQPSDEIPVTDDVIAVSGGCVTGGKGTLAGGIFIGNELYLQGGNIVGNTGRFGGGIAYMEGYASITGGTIVGNTSTNGCGAFYATCGTFTGGVISYNSGLGGAIYENELVSDIDFIVGGTVQIHHNKGTSFGDNLAIFKPIKLASAPDEPKNGMNIGITLLGGTSPNIVSTAGAISTNGTADDAQYFHADNSTYEVAYNAGSGSGGYLELVISNAYKWYYDDTSASTFTISNIDELEALAALVNSGVAFEGKTIKLSDNYKNTKMDGTTPAALTTPIGDGHLITENPDQYAVFKGIFDGNGKTVKLEIETSGDTDNTSTYVGLFGCLAGQAENVGTTGTVTAKEYCSFAGGIAGQIDDGTIKNCFSDAVVKIERHSGLDVYMEFAGGLIGILTSGNITNCYSAGNVSADLTSTTFAGVAVGGLVGCSISGSITNCYSAGSLSATGGTISNCTGGVIGWDTGSAGDTSVTNCYYLIYDDTDDSKDVNVGVDTVGEGDNCTVSGCYALDYAQMKGVAGETNEDWVEITPLISIGESSYKYSLTDALNYVHKDGYSFWGVVDGTVNNGYPVFTIDDTVYLVDGKAYSAYTDSDTNTQIAMPEGITYNGDTATYTLSDVKLPLRYEGCLDFSKNTASDVKLVLSGENQLGVSVDMDNVGTLYTDAGATPVANYGIKADGKTLTITGDANSKLTIYDAVQGISADIINVGTSAAAADFKGTLVINDYGATGAYLPPTPPRCCLNATNAVNIHSGTLTLNNEETYAISAADITIDGGITNAKGKQAAIKAESTLTLTEMEISGANETYAAEVKTLTNKSDTEYVTIQPGQQSSSGSISTITVPVSGDKGTVKVQATVSGTNATVKNVTREKIEKVGTGDIVVINLAGLSKSVTGVVIPKTTLENVVAAEAKGLEVMLPNGTIAAFDSTTLSAVASQANGANIRLVVDRDNKAELTLNTAQKETIKELNNPVVLDAYFVSNGVRITDFNGGEAEITATYPTTKPVRVWYVADDGTKTLVPSTYDGKVVTFTVTHFSHYAVEQLDGSSFNTCPQDETCVYAGFADADTKEWYHDGVHFCVENGYMVGVGNNKFAPNDTLSRAMIVTMLWRMEGSPVADYAMTFTDVAADLWYTEAVRWAQSTGVVTGYNDETFGPDDDITREQLAAILMRYAVFKGVDVSEAADLTKFTDAESISSWATENIKWANAVDIITGRTETTIVPTGNATRAEAACMIQRFCDNVAK